MVLFFYSNFAETETRVIDHIVWLLIWVSTGYVPIYLYGLNVPIYLHETDGIFHTTTYNKVRMVHYIYSEGSQVIAQRY